MMPSKQSELKERLVTQPMLADEVDDRTITTTTRQAEKGGGICSPSSHQHTTVVQKKTSPPWGHLEHRSVTWNEIFSDLLIVVTIQKVGEGFKEAEMDHVSTMDILKFIVLYSAVFWFYFLTVCFFNRFAYGSSDGLHRFFYWTYIPLMAGLSMSVQNCMLLDDYQDFSIFYACLRCLLAGMWLTTAYVNVRARSFCLWFGCCGLLSAVLWVCEALVTNETSTQASLSLWVLSLSVDFASFLAPDCFAHGWWQSVFVPVNKDVLSERLAAFVLISLGEVAVTSASVRLSSKHDTLAVIVTAEHTEVQKEGRLQLLWTSFLIVFTCYSLKLMYFDACSQHRSDYSGVEHACKDNTNTSNSSSSSSSSSANSVPEDRSSQGRLSTASVTSTLTNPLSLNPSALPFVPPSSASSASSHGVVLQAPSQPHASTIATTLSSTTTALQQQHVKKADRTHALYITRFRGIMWIFLHIPFTGAIVMLSNMCDKALTSSIFSKEQQMMYVLAIGIISICFALMVLLHKPAEVVGAPFWLSRNFCIVTRMAASVSGPLILALTWYVVESIHHDETAADALPVLANSPSLETATFCHASTLMVVVLVMSLGLNGLDMYGQRIRRRLALCNITCPQEETV